MNRTVSRRGVCIVSSYLRSAPLLLAVTFFADAQAGEPFPIFADGFEAATASPIGQDQLTGILVINPREVSRQDGGAGVEEITVGFDLQNSGDAAENVSVAATTTDPVATVANGVSFVGTVPANDTLLSAGTITLRQPASSPVDFDALSFDLIGELIPSAVASEALSSGLGGTLSLTTTAGAGFDLEIPPGGLPDGGSVITVSEVASLPNLPQGFELVAGVRLEPDGQTFTRNNRVSVSVPSGTRDPGEVLVAFFADNDGSAFRYLPLVNTDPITAMTEGQQLEFEIPHFTSGGIGKTDNACQDPPPPGASAEDRNSHRIQQAACAAAVDQANGSEGTVDTDVVFSALDDWLENPQDGIRKRIEDAINTDPPLDLDAAETLGREALRLAAAGDAFLEVNPYFAEVSDLIERLLVDIRDGILSECTTSGLTLDKVGDLARIASNLQQLTNSELTDLQDFTCPDALAVAPVSAPIVTLGDTVVFEVLTSDDVVASLVADDLVKNTIIDARSLVGSSAGLANIRGTEDGRVLAEATQLGLVTIDLTINVPAPGGGTIPRPTTGEVRVLPELEGEYTVVVEQEEVRGIGGRPGDGFPPPRPICQDPFAYANLLGGTLTISNLELIPESDFNFLSGETFYGYLGTATLDGIDWPLTAGFIIFDSARDDRPPGSEGSLPRVFLDGEVSGIDLVLGSGPTKSPDTGNVGSIVGGIPLERSISEAYSDACGTYINYFGFRGNTGFTLGPSRFLESDGSQVTGDVQYRIVGREFTRTNVFQPPSCRAADFYFCDVNGTINISKPLAAPLP